MHTLEDFENPLRIQQWLLKLWIVKICYQNFVTLAIHLEILGNLCENWTVLKFSEIICSSYTVETSRHTSKAPGFTGGLRWSPPLPPTPSPARVPLACSLRMGTVGPMVPVAWLILTTTAGSRELGWYLWYRRNKKVSTSSVKDLSPWVPALRLSLSIL